MFRSSDISEFGVSKVTTSTQDRKKDKEHGKLSKIYEDVELQALLDEDDSQTQNQLVDQLNVSQQTVSKRLREMEKIQKIGKWISRELNDKQMKHMLHFARSLQKEVVFVLYSYRG